MEAIVGRTLASVRPALRWSATGEGVDTLFSAIERPISTGRPASQGILDPADGQGLNWLYEQTEVLDRRTDGEGKLHLVARVASEKEPRLRTRFPVARRIA